MTKGSRVPATGAAAPFWEAAERHVLMLQRCEACDRYVHYPRARCPHCFSDRFGWCESAGLASLYSYTVVHRSIGPGWKVPYTVGLVDLDEGVRMMSNIVEAEPADLSVGMRLSLRFIERDGDQLPVFAPA